MPRNKPVPPPPSKPKLPADSPFNIAVADISPTVIAALQAFAKGEANPGQQTAAFKWIVEAACATYDLSYRPNSERDTCFMEGRRFVGLQIVKIINVLKARTSNARTRSDSEQPGG